MRLGDSVSGEWVGEEGRRGWSSHSSVGGAETSFSFLSVTDLRLTKERVGSELIVDMVLLAASRDGVDAMDSLETERDDMNPGSFSSSTSCRLASSPSISSTGSSSISNGDRNLSDDSLGPSRLHSCTNSSMDTRDCCELRRRWRDLGGGMAVTASKAATAGGSASGRWAGSVFRGLLPPCWPCWPLLLTVCERVLGWPRGCMSIGGEGMLTGSLVVRGSGCGFWCSCTAGGVERGLAVVRPRSLCSNRSGEGEGGRRYERGTIMFEIGGSGRLEWTS